MKRLLSSILFSVWLFQACGDFFSTAEVSPKPATLNHYGTLLKKSGETAYLMTEKLAGEGSAVSEKTVTRKKVTFQYQQDSVLESGDSLILFKMSVSNLKSGKIDLERLFLAKFEESSIQYTSLPNEAGPRFFLLKTAAVQGDSLPGGAYFFETLPSVLLTRSQWTKTRGSFEFDRRIVKLDTLVHKNVLEETWLVLENVTFGPQPVMSGRFWYGKSGMLKSIQIWENFDYRNSLGNKLGNYKIERTFTLI